MKDVLFFLTIGLSIWMVITSAKIIRNVEPVETIIEETETQEAPGTKSPARPTREDRPERLNEIYISPMESVADEWEPDIYIYKNRDELDPTFQWHFADLWRRFDLPEEWYIYAIAIVYQESAFNPETIHLNGDGSRDFGLLQYNERWWSERCERYDVGGAEITNNFIQAYIFVRQTRDRIDRGKGLEEWISAHRRGDYGDLDLDYISKIFEISKNLSKKPG